MPRPIRYQQRYELSPARLFATLVDREFLEAKLASIGGQNAVVLDLATTLGTDADSAKCTLRQGVGRQDLPTPVQKVLRGDLIIERTETWRATGPDRYDGTIAARVKDAPGTIRGTLRVFGNPAPDAPSAEFSVNGEVKVDIPLVGGKIEEAIAEQVVRLLRREGRFALEWLAR
jgi:hypothetical protein